MTVHSLAELIGHLSKVEQFTEPEREAAAVLASAAGRVFPKGRVYTVLHEDADPALTALEGLAADMREAVDTMALVEDRLTEIKRMRLTPPGGA